MWKTLLALMVSRPNGRLGWLFFLLPALRGPMLVRTVTLMAIAYYLAPRDNAQAETKHDGPRVRDRSPGGAEVLPW